jgi:hypothetical protein
MARSISRSCRASASTRIMFQSTPASSCRRADSQALKRRASATGSPDWAVHNALPHARREGP